MCEIIIAGDLCPKSRTAQLFDESRYSDVFGEVKTVIESADYALVNLEAPIVYGNANPINKIGPNLKCNEKVIEAIKFAGFKGVTLANNHFYDYGEEGVLKTISELENNGIDYLGAGRNLDEAKRTLFKEINGESFAFINCCEHEFSIATDTSAGSNPIDVIGQYYAIKDAKLKAQHVIVIVHGGIEMYQLPTPRMVKTYRFFIEAGADAVINHHQHCFSGYEYYRGKPISYGLGNFCFDWLGKRQEIWKEGYMARLTFIQGKTKIECIPYRQCGEKPAVLLTAIDKINFETKIKGLCDVIADDNKLQAEYQQFLNRTWKNYDMVNPYSNRYLNWLSRKGFLPSMMPSRRLLSILNAMRCESHYDRFVYTLMSKIEKRHN